MQDKWNSCVTLLIWWHIFEVGTEYSILFWSLQIMITWVNSWHLQSRQVIAMYAILLVLLSFCLIFFFQIERGIEWNKKQVANSAWWNKKQVAIFSYLIWRATFWRIQLRIISLLHYRHTRTSLFCTTNHCNLCISYLDYFRKLYSIF
jgi:hypothetical protein